jgi:hypothetical protein
MIVELDSSNKIIKSTTIYPASEEPNRLEFYPNSIIIDTNLIVEDFDLYEVLDGKTPTLIQGWEAVKKERADLYEAEQKQAQEEGSRLQVRLERDSLLLSSDWTQVADAPVDKIAWSTYRQALRDIPSQAGFPNEITWPTEPEV